MDEQGTPAKDAIQNGYPTGSSAPKPPMDQMKQCRSLPSRDKSLQLTDDAGSGIKPLLHVNAWHTEVTMMEDSSYPEPR
jgi:hypothetical protein